MPISKNVILRTKRVNQRGDIIFLIKYGIFYFIIKIILMIFLGILIKTVMSGSNTTKYLPAVGNFIRLIILPMVVLYFYSIEKEEQEIGNSI